MAEQISKSQLDKAGRTIRLISSTPEEIKNATNLISQWRSLYLTPLSAINMLLRNNVQRLFPDALVARRLKRMPSIIKKLKRFSDMQVSRMQDIGGVRVIMNNISDVYKLQEILVENHGNHILKIPPKDYIKAPKQDGYRSLHQIFFYKGRDHFNFDGLSIELQIRTRLQHAWATAVETLGIIEQTSFKSGEGNDLSKMFFRIASALCAFDEGQPLPPGFENTTPESLVYRFKEIDAKTKATHRLKALSVQTIHSTKKHSKKEEFLLLILHTEIDGTGQLKTIPIKGPMGTMLYNSEEQKSKNNPNVSVLLMSVAKLHELREAYPNYYLDASLFLQNMERICLKFK